MNALWGMGLMSLAKLIIVVDKHVNVRDPEEAWWVALNHIDPERDIEFVLGPVDVLDHSSRLPQFGSHMGVDATRKWATEGFTRDWPAEIRHSAETLALVEKKWAAYGLGERAGGPGSREGTA